VLAVLLAGCGGSGQSGSQTSTVAAASGSGMDMNSNAASGGGMEVNGIKPIPMRQLASTTWQGMKIVAQEATAVPFIVYDGTRERMIRPGKKASFHLMVMLTDAHTGVTIPYATVWATIRKQGKVVYDERQWPMISAFMGPHYGNDVDLPGPGKYQLSLLISPPVSARHLEYQHVWLHPHRVEMAIDWRPTS
jgi:uncharacterized protein involved in high-affinity Fe2+ transport